MIYGVYANQPSFHAVEFTAGLNVVVSDRNEGSGSKATRNSKGKSTLIQIIHFCLGSDANRSDICVESLKDWVFTIEIDIMGERIKATRSVESPGRILLEGNFKEWPVNPLIDSETQQNFLALDDWKRVLAWSLFGLTDKDKISARSLLCYFIRPKVSAFADPFKWLPQHSNLEIGIYNSFMLGLNWSYAREWFDLDKQENVIKAVHEAIKAGVHETQGELEAKKVQFEEYFERSKAALSSFQVHEKYNDIEKEANRITNQIHEAANQNIVDSRKLALYEQSIENENAPAKTQLETLYNEVGLFFNDNIKKNLADALNFHNQVITNRSLFLKSEIRRIKDAIEDRNIIIKELSYERTTHMKILKTHGALEEYYLLQEKCNSIQEQLEKVKGRLDDIRDKNKRMRSIKTESLNLQQKALIDYENKRNLWEEAVRSFGHNSNELYNIAGQLVIDVTETGYKFGVDIPGGKGGGIGKMKVFSYDLMLIQIQRILRRGIDFLIHDSIIYEGVDARQQAHALELAAQKSQVDGFQYICTLNSDTIPYEEFSSDFNFDSYIRLRLTDDDISGSLLGVEF